MEAWKSKISTLPQLSYSGSIGKWAGGLSYGPLLAALLMAAERFLFNAWSLMRRSTPIWWGLLSMEGP